MRNELVNDLQLHINSLKSTLNRSSSISNQICFARVFEMLFSYIRNEALNINIDTQNLPKTCCICREYINEINQRSIALNCGHVFCKNSCLKTLVRTSNKNFSNWKETKCPTCESRINENIIVNAFGGKSDFDNILANYELSRPTKFRCDICYKERRFDESIILDCTHRYDIECITNVINNSINQGLVSDKDISCLYCRTAISPDFVRGLVTKPTWEKYVKFRNRDFKPQPVQMVFYKCAGNDCEYFVLLDLEVEVFRCPLCKTVKCPKCRDDPHTGITCSENCSRKKAEEEKIAKEKQIDEEFKEAARILGYRTCPHCKSMCEKISGCKFIRCYSPICRGKNNFCLLCECSLTEAQHYSHYKTKGPFSEVCNTMDGNKD